MTERKIWLVEHPTHRYVEDVKAMARSAGLIIVDAAAAGADEIAAALPAEDAPMLTLRAGFNTATKSATKKA
jgi:hypothetical protein